MCNMTAYPGKVRRNNKLSDRSDLSDLSDLLPAGLRGIRQIFLYFYSISNLPYWSMIWKSAIWIGGTVDSSFKGSLRE